MVVSVARVLPVELIERGHRVTVLNAHGRVPIDIHYTWVEYAAVVGGVAGALVAIVALIFANVSKNAANASLEIMRKEAAAAQEERERKSELSLTLHVRAFERDAPSPPAYVILDIGVENNGRRPAERVLCNVFIPDGLHVRPCDADGNDAEFGTIFSAETTYGEHGGGGMWSDVIGPVGPKTITVRNLRCSPSPGTLLLEGALFHEDLDNGELDRAWLVQIPEMGTQVAIEPTEPKPDETDTPAAYYAQPPESPKGS
jgi:hypothetical protein